MLIYLCTYTMHLGCVIGNCLTVFPGRTVEVSRKFWAMLRACLTLVVLARITSWIELSYIWLMLCYVFAYSTLEQLWRDLIMPFRVRCNDVAEARFSEMLLLKGKSCLVRWCEIIGWASMHGVRDGGYCNVTVILILAFSGLSYLECDLVTSGSKQWDRQFGINTISMWLFDKAESCPMFGSKVKENKANLHRLPRRKGRTVVARTPSCWFKLCQCKGGHFSYEQVSETTHLGFISQQQNYLATTNKPRDFPKYGTLDQILGYWE